MLLIASLWIRIKSIFRLNFELLTRKTAGCNCEGSPVKSSIGVVRCQESPVTVPTIDPGVTIVRDIKKDRRLQDYPAAAGAGVRDPAGPRELKLKLAAIPTGAPLREQVTLI